MYLRNVRNGTLYWRRLTQKKMHANLDSYSINANQFKPQISTILFNFVDLNFFSFKIIRAKSTRNSRMLLPEIVPFFFNLMKDVTGCLETPLFWPYNVASIRRVPCLSMHTKFWCKSQQKRYLSSLHLFCIDAQSLNARDRWSIFTGK